MTLDDIPLTWMPCLGKCCCSGGSRRKLRGWSWSRCLYRTLTLKKECVQYPVYSSLMNPTFKPIMFPLSTDYIILIISINISIYLSIHPSIHLNPWHSLTFPPDFMISLFQTVAGGTCTWRCCRGSSASPATGRASRRLRRRRCRRSCSLRCGWEAGHGSALGRRWTITALIIEIRVALKWIWILLILMSYYLNESRIFL